MEKLEIEIIVIVEQRSELSQQEKVFWVNIESDILVVDYDKTWIHVAAHRLAYKHIRSEWGLVDKAEHG
jgi:endo-beta-N-acetylglucosaminidase D